MSDKVILGDCLNILKTMQDQSVQCCVTSPPYYGLRDYGVDGQIGLEQTPDEYVNKLVNVFREVKRVLRDDGTLWLNLGDSYAGSGMGAANYPDSASVKQLSNHGSTTAKGRAGFVPDGLKPKDLIGIPWRVAFALQADGWYLRSDIIWHKPNPMPESVKDRPTKAHEYIFLLAKSENYFYDQNAILEKSTWAEKDKRFITGPSSGGKAMTGNYAINKGGAFRKDGNRNKRSVWTLSTHSFKDAHFAVFPEKLIEPCILAGCPVGGMVLDPFAGSGTTGVVAVKHGRDFIGIELNPEYVEMASRRINKAQQQMRLPI